MVDYAALATTAKRLIDDAGRNVTLTRTDRTAGNPATPWRAGGTNDTTIGPFKAAVVGFTEEEIDGTLVSRGDKKALLSGLDGGTNLIEQFNILTDGAEIWKIMGVTVVNPGDTRVVYKIQLRK
jgi:hypothetical protein